MWNIGADKVMTTVELHYSWLSVLKNGGRDFNTQTARGAGGNQAK